MAALGAAMNGNSVLVYTSDDSGTSKEALGSQTGVTFSESRDTIDITDKQDLGSTNLKGGKYTSTCSANALYIDNNQSFIDIRAAIRNNTELKLYRYEPQGTVPSGGTEAAPAGWEMADCLVTSISEDFPQDGAGTCSVEFAITGTWGAAS